MWCKDCAIWCNPRQAQWEFLIDCAHWKLHNIDSLADWLTVWLNVWQTKKVQRAGKQQTILPAASHELVSRLDSGERRRRRRRKRGKRAGKECEQCSKQQIRAACNHSSSSGSSKRRTATAALILEAQEIDAVVEWAQVSAGELNSEKRPTLVEKKKQQPKQKTTSSLSANEKK